MGNDGGHGRSTSLPPELDAIDAGWDADPAETAPRRTPSSLPFYSEPPTLPREDHGQRPATRQDGPSMASARSRPLRPSERVTAPPPKGVEAMAGDPFAESVGLGTVVSNRGSTDVRRTAETDPPSEGPPFPGPSSDPLELAEFEDDDIYDRPTEDVFDRPTLDVQADELAFSQPGGNQGGESATANQRERHPGPEELEFELERPSARPSVHPSVHLSALPTAPPPGQWQEDIGRMRTVPRGPGGRDREASPYGRDEFELGSDIGTDSTPPRRSRTTGSPRSASDSLEPLSGLDLVQAEDIGPSLKPATQFKQEVATLTSGHTDGPHREMKDRFAMGDFSGALERAEAILTESPTDREAEGLAQKCRDVLVDMYASRIAGLDRRVRVVMAADQVRWLSLDHKSGFLLSMVDGSCSVEDLLDVCGMQRLDALKIICSLLDQNVIELG